MEQSIATGHSGLEVPQGNSADLRHAGTRVKRKVQGGHELIWIFFLDNRERQQQQGKVTDCQIIVYIT